MVDISGSIQSSFKNLFAGMYSVIDIAFDISGSISTPGKVFIDISKNNNKGIFVDNTNNDFSANVIDKTNFGTNNSFTSVSWDHDSQRLTFDVSANYTNEKITIPQFQFKVLGDISMNSSISTTSHIELSFNGTSVGPKSLKDLTVKHPIKDVSLVFNPSKPIPPYVNDSSLSFDLNVTLDPSFDLNNNNTFKIDFHANDLSNSSGGAYPIMPNSNVFSSNNIQLVPLSQGPQGPQGQQGQSLGFDFSYVDMSWNKNNDKKLMFKTSNAQSQQGNDFKLTFKDISGPNNYISDMNPKIQIIEKNTDAALGSNQTVYKPIQHVPTKKIQYNPNDALSNLTTSFDNSFVGISNRITVDFSLNAELKKSDKLQIQFFDSSNGNHPSRIFTDKNNILIGGDASSNFNDAKINNGVITITVSNHEYNVKSATGYPGYPKTNSTKRNINLKFDVSNNSDTQYDLCGQKLRFDPSKDISSVKDSNSAFVLKNDKKITLFKPYFRIDISKTSIQVVPDTTTEKIMLDISTNIVLGPSSELLFNINEDASNSELLDSSFIKDISYVNLKGSNISSNYNKNQNQHILTLSNNKLQPAYFSSNEDINLAYVVSDLCNNKLSSITNFKWPSVDISVDLSWSDISQNYTTNFDHELKNKMKELIKENSTMNQQQQQLLHYQQQPPQQQPPQQQVNTIKISMKGNTLSGNGQTIINTSKKKEHESINKIHELLKNQQVSYNQSKKINEILQKTTISQSDIDLSTDPDLSGIYQSISGELTNIQKQKEKTNKDRILYSNTSGPDITSNIITSNINSQFMQSLNTSGISFEKLAASNLDPTIKTNIENKIAGNFEFEFRSDISGYQNSAGVFSLSGDINIKELFSSDINENIKESNKIIEARIKKMRDTGGNNFKYIVNSIDQAPINIEEQFAHYKEVINASTNSKPKFQIFDSKSTGTGTDISANDFFRNNMKKVKTGASGEFIIPMIALDTSGDQITIDFSNSKMLKPRPGTKLTIKYEDATKTKRYVSFRTNGPGTAPIFSTDAILQHNINPKKVEDTLHDGTFFTITYDLSVNNSIEIFGYRMKVTNPNPDASLVYIVNDKCETRFEIEDLDKLQKYWGDNVTDASARAIEISLNSIQIKETPNSIKTLDQNSLQILKSLIQKSGNFDNNSDSRRSLAILDIMENKPGIDKLEINGNELSGNIVDPRSIESTDISYIISKSIIKNIKDGNYTQVWTGISNEITGVSMNVYIPMKIDEELPIMIKDSSNVIHDSGIKYIKKYNNGRYEHTLENAISELDYIELEFKEEVEVALDSSIKSKNIKIKNLNKLNDIQNTRIYKDGNNLVIFKGYTYNDIIFGDSDMYYATNRVEIKSQKPSIDLDNNKIVEYTFKLKNGLSIKMNFGSAIITDAGTGAIITSSDTTETPRIFMSTPLSEKYYSVKNRHYKMQFTSRAFNSATQLYKTNNNMIINQQLSTKGSSNRLRKLKAKAIAQNKYSKQ